ncbi:MAG: FecR domain-containing protein [Chitinophagaceae bacterium]|nr:FecR domain-containing protein [Chitinophagaceae bacterium]
MMPDQNEQELRSLFSLWLNGDGDEAILQRLSELAEEPGLTAIWQSLLAGIPEQPAIDQQHTGILDQVYQNLLVSEPELRVPAPVRGIKTWLKYAAAAVLLISIGSYIFFYSGTGKQEKQQLGNIHPVENGQPSNPNKAVLTLGSGKQIILDSSGNGKLADQAGAVVMKSAEGQIVYSKNDAAPQQTTDFNTVATPRGGEYKITLPDGTKVWLNAASSITFPTAFNGSDRTVTVQGEVYLDVAKHASQPFRIKVNDAIIDVLGTELNVNAYNDEPVTRTTLLDGSIKLSKGVENKILKPGQQVWFRPNSDVLTVTGDIDTEQVIAWKNGSFDFRNQDIGTVMNQVGRWYNMDIVYEGKKPDTKIIGMMGRNTDLVTLLKSLELTSGIKFKVEQAAAATLPGKIIVQQ